MSHPRYYFSVLFTNMGVCSLILGGLTGSPIVYGFAIGSLVVGLVSAVYTEISKDEK